MKWQVLGVLLSTLAAVLGLGIIVASTNPTEASIIVKGLFFLVAGTVLWGFCSLVIYFWHYRFSKKFQPEASFYQSLNYGLVTAVVGVVVLLIKHFMV